MGSTVLVKVKVVFYAVLNRAEGILKDNFNLNVLYLAKLIKFLNLENKCFTLIRAHCLKAAGVLDIHFFMDFYQEEF